MSHYRLNLLDTVSQWPLRVNQPLRATRAPASAAAWDVAKLEISLGWAGLPAELHVQSMRTVANRGVLVRGQRLVGSGVQVEALESQGMSDAFLAAWFSTSMVRRRSATMFDESDRLFEFWMKC